MDHPHEGILPAPHSPAQTKTVFMPSTGQLALLVENRRGRRTEKALTFTDPHAALSWCQQHHAGFVFFLAPDPLGN